MQDNETVCGKCGSQFGESTQLQVTPPHAKSKKPLIAMIGIPLAVVIVGASIFALRGKEQNTVATPYTASSIASVPQSETKVQEESESEPAIAPWKQMYFDAAKEDADKFISHYWETFRDDPLLSEIVDTGLSGARLYDMDEDGIPELFLDYYYHDVAVNEKYGTGLTVRDGVLKVGDGSLGFDGETSPALYVSNLYRNPQTGAYLGISPAGKGVDYYLHENGQWRFLFRTTLFTVSGAKTGEGEELEKRLADSYGHPDQDALDAFTASYSETVEFAEISFSNDTSWISIAQELIGFFNAYDGDDRFDVSPAARLAKPWGETYAEIIKKLYNKQEQSEKDRGDIRLGYENDGYFLSGFQISDLDFDGIPELFVKMYGHDFTQDVFMISRIYRADGNYREVIRNSLKIGTGDVNRIYRHKESGRVLFSIYQWGVASNLPACRITYHFSDTLESYLEYMVSIDTYTNSIVSEHVFINGSEQQGMNVHPAIQDESLHKILGSYNLDYLKDELDSRDPYVAAFLSEYLKDYEEVNTDIHSFELKYSFNNDSSRNLIDGTLSQAITWVKGLPGAMDSGEPEQHLTEEQTQSLYDLYIRYITAVQYRSGETDMRDLVTMSAGIPQMQALYQPLSSGDSRSSGVSVPGVTFTHSITLEDWNGVFAEIYGDNSLTMTKADFSATGLSGVTTKNPSSETFNGAQFFAVYSEALERILIGRSELADASEKLVYIENAGRYGSKILVDAVLFFLCRGDYRDNAFHPSLNGSRYMILDKFGEVEISGTEYEQLLNSTGSAIQKLLENLIDKYDIQGSRVQANLNGNVDNPESITVEQIAAYTEESYAAREGMESFDSATARTKATETFRQYYLSFLSAINELDGSLISHCTPNMQARQEKRIWEFNSENTFENLRIMLDEDSFSFIYEDGIPTARFTVRCENDMWWRNNTAPKELNTATLQVVAQYSQSRGDWEIIYTLLDNSSQMGSNLTDISK